MQLSLILIAFLLSLSCFAQQPDIILFNGKIFTADKKQLYAEAIAITGNKIAAVGKNAVIEKLARAKTKKINLEGKTVVPGFNDAHTHVGPHYPARRFEFIRNPADPTPWRSLKTAYKK